MKTRAGRPVCRPSWYLNKSDIRPLQNTQWSPKIRKYLFEQVCLKKRSVVEVRVDLADMFKVSPKSYSVSTIRIYNQIRLAKKAPGALLEFGACIHCGHMLTIQEVEEHANESGLYLCRKCKKKNSDYKRKYRMSLLRRGMCTACNKRKKLPGKTFCRYCLSATNRRRLTQGLCNSCGKRPLSKKSSAFCDPCLKMNRSV